MNTCKDCKWWEDYNCRNFEKLGGAVGPVSEETDSLTVYVDPYGPAGNAEFETGPDFGCIHHEPKETK